MAFMTDVEDQDRLYQLSQRQRPPFDNGSSSDFMFCCYYIFGFLIFIDELKFPQLNMSNPTNIVGYTLAQK